MRKKLSRIVTMLAAALMLASFASNLALAAPAEQSTKVQGTITQYTKDKITIRANGKDTEIALDGKKTMMVGRPAVDKQATVWYKKGPNGNLWATKIEVPQKATPNADANADAPASGKVDGTFTQVTKDRVTVRAADKEWKFMLDGKRTMTLGKPAVDKTCTVWFKKDKGNLWATKIQVNK